MTTSLRTAGLEAKLQKHAFKLVRAAVLATALVTLGSLPSEADEITLTFTSEDAVNDYVFEGGYIFRLGFDLVLQDFSVLVEDILTSGPSPITTGGVLNGFKCVEMANPDGASCVTFQATPLIEGDPEDFWAATDGKAINIGIQYLIYGFPEFCDGSCDPEDPVDVGETDNFSQTLIVADIVSDGDFTETIFRMAHLPGGATQYEDITFGEHCAAGTLDTCAASQDPVFHFTSTTTAVPEPASILLFGPGALGLAYLKRRRGGRRG